MDYTYLADVYLKHPNYADSPIDAMLSVVGIDEDDKVCGRWGAHLTLMLAARGLNITAVEPIARCVVMALNGRQLFKIFTGTRGLASEPTR